ncbi:MAG: extracellular solute-binding protein family 1 [Pseudarthrobacter sp.]|nr:extracellular solute-binding protein family 1 [Pseudarthrobacter sp.]
MKTRTHALAGIVLAVTAALGLAGCGGSPAPAATDPVFDYDAISGEMTVYSALQEDLTEEWVDAFTEETGVKVTVRQGSDAGLANQLIQEGAASPADVLLTANSPAMAQVEGAGLLADVDADTIKGASAEFLPSTRKWTGIAGRATVLVYNNAKLTEEQLPASMLDLAGAAWKGKWAAAPASADFQAIVAALLELKGEAATAEWLQGVKENATAYADNNAAMQAVNAGEVDAALIFNDDYSADQAQAGENSGNITPYYFQNRDPGAFMSISGGGVLKTAKNEEAAQAFLRFITDSRGQDILKNGTSFAYIIAPEVPPSDKLVPLDDLQAPTVDPGTLDAGKVTELMSKAGLL